VSHVEMWLVEVIKKLMKNSVIFPLEDSLGTFGASVQDIRTPKS